MNTIELQINLEQRLAEIGRQVGNTPLVRLRGVYEKPGVEIWAKLEWQQIGQSVKARAAYAIMGDAVRKGLLGGGKSLLDATSGNTGIAYAAIGAALGVGVTLVVPANISAARRQILGALGAELVYSSPLEGTDGAQALARELAEAAPDRYYYADQYSHAANPQAHIRTTAAEIWTQTGGTVTHFVAGLGTTGSFTGTATGLKRLNPGIVAVELQPDFALHALEGWKHLETAVVPKIYDAKVADLRLEVSTERAYEVIKLVARKEGLLLSPSAAANLVGAIAVAEGIEEGKVVTLFADSGDKYGEVYQEIF